MAVPALLGYVVNQMTDGSQENINWACIWMIVIIFVSSLFVWLRGSLFNTISARISKHLCYDLFLHLVNKDVAFFDQNKTGDLLSRISNDV